MALSGVGIPIKVLHESEGHVVTIETITGEIFRGKLIEAEDNMNCQMAAVTMTGRDGRNSQLENIFIRGSKIRFMILPDMLKNSPMIRNIQKGKSSGLGLGLGRGRGGIPGRGTGGMGRGAGGPGMPGGGGGMRPSGSGSSSRPGSGPMGGGGAPSGGRDGGIMRK